MSREFWKPALYKGSTETLMLLPKPVMSCRIQAGWKFDMHEVPLQQGAFTYDHSPTGKSITISGAIAFVGEEGSVDRVDFIDEDAMWSRYETTEVFLNMAHENDSFEFFLYHDPNEDAYKKLISCVPVSFDLDCGDSARSPFKYTLKLFARNPQYYNTEEGET